MTVAEHQRQNRHWWDHAIILAVMTTSVLVMYHFFLTPPYWPKLFGSFDYCRYFGPQAYFMDSTIHTGEIPLWNPLTFCGAPYAASPQQTAFYPPQLIRSLLTFAPTPRKTHVGLAILAALHSILAGYFTYLLAREYRLSRPAAFIAAITYMFGPHFVRRMLEQWILVAVATWMPLLFLLMHRVLQATTLRAKFWYGTALSLIIAISVLAGFPQLSFYTGLMLLFYYFLHYFLRVQRSDIYQPEILTHRIFNALMRDGAVFVVAVILAIALSAVLLLPASELVGASTRIKTNGFEVEAAAQDLTWVHLFKCMLVYVGPTISETGCRAAGIGVLILALLGLTHSRRRDVLLFGILFIIMTDCTLGPPFPFGRLVHALDICQFSSPWRAGILAGLPLAILAGLGIDAVANTSHGWLRGGTRSLFVLLAGILFLYFLAQWMKSGAYFPVSPYVLYIPTITVLFLVIIPWIPWKKAGIILISGLIFAEMFAWHYTYFPFFLQHSGYRGGDATVAGADRLFQDNFRGVDRQPNTLFYTLRPAMNGYDPVCLLKSRQLLCDDNRGHSYARNIRDWEVTSENQRGNLFLKRSFWLTREYLKGPLPGKQTLFPPTTTVFLPEPPSDIAIPASTVHSFDTSVSADVETIHVASGSDLMGRIQKNGRNFTCTLPMFTLDGRHAALRICYSAEVRAELSPSFQDMDTGRDTYGKHVTLLPTDGSEQIVEVPLPDYERVLATFKWTGPRDAGQVRFSEVTAVKDNADEHTLIDIVERRANSVRVHLKNLPAARLLLFVDTAYPGWKAFVDGAAVPLLTANDIFKAVPVSAGNHEVLFVFHPWRVYAGAVISLIMLIVVLSGLITMRRYIHDIDGLPRTGNA